MKWLLIKSVAELLNVSPRAIQAKLTDNSGRVETRNYRFEYKYVKGVRGVGNRALRKDHYEILLESLPEVYQNVYAEQIVRENALVGGGYGHEALKQVQGDSRGKNPVDVLRDAVNRDNGMDDFWSYPENQRNKALLKEKCIKESAVYRGKELEKWVNKVWNIAYPECTTSVKSLYRWRTKYKKQGLLSLIEDYGKGNSAQYACAGKYETYKGYYTKIKPEWYQRFKECWLNQGVPSVQSCWTHVVGYARDMENVKDVYAFVSSFPSPQTFTRAVFSQYGESGVYRARYGYWKWNKKYGGYVERDNSDIKPGECWVSDHAQLDVACYAPDGSVFFPWITVWRDYKTGLWLAWNIYCGNPNSDRIFDVFYRAAAKYGKPTDIYIDNGKDYRSKDFAGGRPKAHQNIVDAEQCRLKEDIINIVTNETSRPMSMIERLEIMAHFALPYNGQVKPVERDFKHNKEYFSRHNIGFRGGNVVERPEILQEYINSGKILKFEELKQHFDYYINNILHVMPNNGRYHLGRSRLKMWEDELEEIRRINLDELRLFCMRSSKLLTITRNGIRDSVNQLTYWGDWMVKYEGASKTENKCYIRRNPLKFEEAWVFDVQDRFIDKAYVTMVPKGLARTELDHEEVKQAISVKRRKERIVAEAIHEKSFTTEEDIRAMEMGARALAEAQGNLPTGVTHHEEIDVETEFADVLATAARREHEGEYDEALFAPAVIKNPEREEELDIWASPFNK